MPHRRHFDAILGNLAKIHLFCIPKSHSFPTEAKNSLKSDIYPPPPQLSNNEFAYLNTERFYKTLLKTVIQNTSLITVTCISHFTEFVGKNR